MIPETNHDVEISIYHDFLEDQGIIVDRNPEEQDQWCHEYKHFGIGDFVGGAAGFRVGCGVGCGVGCVGGHFISGRGRGGYDVGSDCYGGVGGVYDQSTRVGG